MNHSISEIINDRASMVSLLCITGALFVPFFQLYNHIQVSLVPITFMFVVISLVNLILSEGKK